MRETPLNREVQYMAKKNGNPATQVIKVGEKYLISVEKTTESASDDDDRRPSFIHEKLPNSTTKEDNLTLTTPIKLAGVYRRHGRWWSDINNLFTKRKHYLGTFKTREEASNAFAAKKLELPNRKAILICIDDYRRPAKTPSNKRSRVDYETVVKDSNNNGQESSCSKEEEADQTSNTPNKFRGIRRRVDDETILKDSNKGEESSRSKEEEGDPNRNTPNKFRGIHQEKTGRWGASIQDPFKKRRIWLGTFDTPEEASNTYEAKMLEFLTQKEGLTPQTTTLKKFVGAYPRHTGMWYSNIRDPFTGRKIHLGEFDSPEEASNAWVAKKQEFSLKLKQARSWEQTESAESSSFEGYGQKLENSSLNNDGKQSCRRKEVDHKLRGVRLRKSGRWSAKIYDPFSKREIWLGTFDTPDEASNVCAAKRLEFKQRKKGRISIDATQSVSESGISVEQNEDFESSFHNDCQQREPMSLSVKRPGVVLEKVVPNGKEADEAHTTLNRIRGVRRKKTGRWGAMINDPFTKHQTCLDKFDTPEEASKVSEQFDERKEAQICMDLALPEYEPVKCGQELVDRQILEQILIDSNGFLLGEFSNLDDELRIL